MRTQAVLESDLVELREKVRQLTKSLAETRARLAYYEPPSLPQNERAAPIAATAALNIAGDTSVKGELPLVFGTSNDLDADVNGIWLNEATLQQCV